MLMHLADQPELAGAVSNAAVVQLWNQRTSACSRPHVLLPAQQQLSLAPTNLSLAQQEVRPAAGGSNGSSSGINSSPGLSVIPEPLAEAGLQAAEDDSTSASADVTVLVPNGTYATWNSSTAKTALPRQWPPPGGERIDCPATLRGVIGMQQQTVVDVAFTRGLFAVSGPAAQRTDAATVGAAATADAAALGPTGGVLRFEELRLVNLPQAEGANMSIGNGSSQPGSTGGMLRSMVREAVMPTAPGLWISLLPRQAYTHLLWFADR